MIHDRLLPTSESVRDRSGGKFCPNDSGESIDNFPIRSYAVEAQNLLGVGLAGRLDGGSN